MSAFTSGGATNRMRWDRERRGFMEAWYTTLTDRPSGIGLWIRQTITSPVAGAGEPYCEAWAFAFHPDEARNFAGKERFLADALEAPAVGDLVVRVDQSHLSTGSTGGRVVAGDRELAWSLDFEPAARTYHHLPEVLRSRIAHRVSTVCSPNLGIVARGEITLDGERVAIAEARGQQGHRWGRRHAPRWVWCHCSSFTETDATFEGLTARSPVGGLQLTFVVLRLGDDEIVLQALPLALRARSDHEMPAWVFTSRDHRWRVVGSARAHPADLMQVTYTEPDGSQVFCANSERASLALEVYRKEPGGWRHHASLTCERQAHLEFGRSAPFEELPVVL